MPIYEYKCRTHGHVFEERQTFSDPDLTNCKVCQEPVDRLISASAFALRGEGWYTSEYKRVPASASEAKGETAGAKKTEECSKAACASDAGETCSNNKPA